MKKLSIVLSALVFSLVLGLSSAKEANAFSLTWKSCHKVVLNSCVNLSFLNSCPSGWSNGSCPIVTPSPVPTIVPTVEPTVEPTAEPSVEPSATPSAEPSVEPTATPEATEEPSSEPEATVAPVITEPVSAPLSEAGAFVCGGIKPATIVWGYAVRIGSNAVVHYVPTVLGGESNIRFRELGSSEWQHALRDFPNLGLSPISSLKNKMKYEFQITNGNGCNQSDWSPVFKGL